MDGTQGKPAEAGNITDRCKSAIALTSSVEAEPDGSLVARTHYLFADHAPIEIRISFDCDGYIQIDDMGGLIERFPGNQSEIAAHCLADQPGEGLTYADGVLLAVVDRPEHVGHAMITLARTVMNLSLELGS